MIYDAFIFFNELDLLEIRLNLLSNYVDKFILVEATTTFSGKPKPLYYKKNKKRYAKFNDKIIHIIVDDLPTNSEYRWPAETAQRMAFMRGLTDAQDNDIVIASDVDEIWNPEVLPKQITVPIAFRQKAKGFYLNSKPDKIQCYSMAMRYEIFKKKWRRLVNRRLPHIYDNFIQIDNGGWHWSYLGGAVLIRKKLESFAHVEFDNERGKRLWLKTAKLQKQNCYIPPESDPDWPLWLKDNWRKYSHLTIEKSMNQNVDTLGYILDGYNIRNKTKVEFCWSRAGTLPKLFRKLGFKTGVEVGVAKGFFSKAICVQCPDIKLYSVDAWKLWPGATHGETQKMMDSLYASAVNRLSGLPNNKIIRGWSMDVVGQFKDNSLDFVYIDAAHDYENVLQDIREWSKKVRKGGIVCGDDYISPDFNDSNYAVKRAVDDWVKKKKIKPLIILNKVMVPGWMYVKT